MVTRKLRSIPESHQGATVVPPVFRLPDKDEALFREMLEAYVTRRRGALRHQHKSVDRDTRIILEFLQFSGKAPWYWTEEGFEKWSYEIGVVRTLAVSSQRHYQGAIRGFLAYLIENVKFRNVVRREYGVDLVQICHPENCIPHISERELTRERPALTHAEINQFFNAYDTAITEAASFKTKDLRPLQRDKAMFYLTYAAGLRASEIIGLNVSSFQPNPNIPELGEYGFISAWGKGSRGSGPKHRMVPVTHLPVAALLAWYIQEIRPLFMDVSDANDQALFFSERGRRIALSTFEARFQHGIALAGLEDRGFTPHCLRHSSVTHEDLRFSGEMVRRKHGHTYQATTQGYMHHPDEFVNEEITRAIGSQLDALLGKDKDKDKE